MAAFSVWPQTKRLRSRHRAIHRVVTGQAVGPVTALGRGSWCFASAQGVHRRVHRNEVQAQRLVLGPEGGRMGGWVAESAKLRL